MGLLADARDLAAGAHDFYTWLVDETTEWFIGEGAWMRANEGKCLAGRTGPHPKEDHPAVDRDGRATTSRLCEHHFTRLGKILHDIEDESRTVIFDPRRPGEWALLPSMAANLDHGGGALASQQAPVRLEPLVLSDRRHGRGDWEGDDERIAAGSTVSMMRELVKYAGLVREARHITYPVSDWQPIAGDIVEGPVCAEFCGHPSCRSAAWFHRKPLPLTVHTERDVLSRQLDWIAEQDWAGAFYDTMRQLLSQLQRANGTAAPSPIPGKCPALVGEKQDAECGGPLWPTKPKATSESKGWVGSTPSAIRCGACRTSWEGAAPLARLALILDRQHKSRAGAR